jgi:hypothetical protein
VVAFILAMYDHSELDFELMYWLKVIKSFKLFIILSTPDRAAKSLLLFLSGVILGGLEHLLGLLI